MLRTGHSQRLMRALAEAGYSRTRPRRAVIDVVAAAPCGLTAAGILERARRAHPTLGLVTVYRTLSILSTLGLVRRILMADGGHSYALAQCSHGHHVICERCHRAVEFEGCELQEMMENVTRQTGYRVTDHWLEVFGLCPSCQALVDASSAAGEMTSG